MEQGSASATVDLDEPRAQVCLGEVNGELGQQPHDWLQGAFSELEGGVTGSVKFGDGSRAVI